MTTVLYHAGILLADSRASRKSPRAPSNEDAYRCVHCGEKAHSARDNTNKIKLSFKKRTFRGETIRAISGAGEAGSIRTQSNAWLYLDDYEKTYGEVFKIVGSVDARSNFDCTIMIVTDKHVHVIDYHKSNYSGLHVDVYGLDQTVAIGSGQMAAKTAIIAYGADAFEAMRIASVVDNSTGGPIQYVEFGDMDESLTICTYVPPNIDASIAEKADPCNDANPEADNLE